MSAARSALLYAGVLAVLAGSLLGVSISRAQQIQFGDSTPWKSKGHVVLLTDSADVRAGVPEEVEVRFRVDPGFHINSHTPKSELLIPTTLKLETRTNMRADDVHYPTGTAFHLEMGSGETLDVYQNEFRIRVRVTAPRGSTELAGTLRYQACDSSSCFPPRTLPVKVLVQGK